MLLLLRRDKCGKRTVGDEGEGLKVMERAAWYD